MAKEIFKTFRHWGGSMVDYYTNGNVLTVKKMLRHKDIRNSMKYIHMIPIKDDEFDVATATTVEEIKQLAGAGLRSLTRSTKSTSSECPKGSTLKKKYQYTLRNTRI